MSQRNRELVILVGMQGAGKTCYCEKFLRDYERISQDEGPRSYQGIVKRLRELLLEGAPRIVIDRTNPMPEQRKAFAEMAKAAGYYVKSVYFDVPVEICQERIRNRKGHPTLPADRMKEAIAMYQSRLNEPKPDECDELVVIDVIRDPPKGASA
jgi:predicted kinase